MDVCVSLACETNDTSDHEQEEHHWAPDRQVEYGRPRFTTAGPDEGEQEREEEVEVADDGDRTKEGGWLGGLGCRGDGQKKVCSFMRVVKGDRSSPQTTQSTNQLILNPAICRVGTSY